MRPRRPLLLLALVTLVVAVTLAVLAAAGLLPAGGGAAAGPPPAARGTSPSGPSPTGTFTAPSPTGSAPPAGAGATATATAPTAAGSASPGAGPTGTPPTGTLPPPEPVLPAPSPTGRPPTTEGLAAVLDPLLDGAAFGPAGAGVGAVVLDAGTGQTLYGRGTAGGRTPASLAKLVTGASVLVHRDPEERLRTRVVAGTAPGEVVLVGAGDPTLTVRAERGGPYPRPAELARLADATAEALAARRGPTATAQPVRVLVDDRLFPTADAVTDAWKPGYVGVNVAPVQALALDGGRRRPGFAARVEDPALAAGRRFAELLAARGVPVAGAVRRGAAPAGAAELAAVESPPLRVLVEQMLRTSDNDLAEALWRQAALGAGVPATFAGGEAAAVLALESLGVPTENVRLRDGSGLSRASRLPPATLGGLLVAATGDDGGRLRPLLTGLPVAGYDGTLARRFAGPAAEVAAGEVRAKTGTLTGVSGLAGTAQTADGRLLLLVLMADRIPPPRTLDARARLDAAAAVLAACGCR